MHLKRAADPLVRELVEFHFFSFVFFVPFVVALFVLAFRIRATSRKDYTMDCTGTFEMRH
jgi:hypothetical protein